VRERVFGGIADSNERAHCNHEVDLSFYSSY